MYSKEILSMNIKFLIFIICWMLVLFAIKVYPILLNQNIGFVTGVGRLASMKGSLGSIIVGDISSMTTKKRKHFSWVTHWQLYIHAWACIIAATVSWCIFCNYQILGALLVDAHWFLGDYCYFCLVSIEWLL